MEKLSIKSKTIISISLFLIVFVALILVATFYDYKVSETLTKDALVDGEYIATDFFGVMLEIFGTSPIYILIACCVAIIFWWSIKVFDKKPWNKIIACVLAVAGIVAWGFFIKDIIAYTLEHSAAFAGLDNDLEATIYEYRHSAAIRGVEVLVAIVLQILTLFAFKNIKEETLKKLFWYVVACAVACIVANLIMAILKGPMGRMRFRAINSDEGQALLNSGLITGRCDDGVLGFTRWYRINKQPSDDIINAIVNQYPGAKDAFKSYPSGHTSAAGMTYALILLPDVVNFKHKKAAKAFCWIFPIVFTGLVAISRIMVGAHFMSDVTFGGTLSFTAMILAREIFINKGSHFFALFPKLNKKSNVEKQIDGADLEAIKNTGDIN